MELANEGIPEKIFWEFKKVGSNFQIKDRTVLFEPRGAWRILAESGFCGGNAEQTALRADHIFGSETLFENLRRVVDEIRTFWMTPSNYFFIPNLTAETAEIK